MVKNLEFCTLILVVEEVQNGKKIMKKYLKQYDLRDIINENSAQEEIQEKEKIVFKYYVQINEWDNKTLKDIFLFDV